MNIVYILLVAVVIVFYLITIWLIIQERRYNMKLPDILCPYCLHKYKIIKSDSPNVSKYSCPKCGRVLPNAYVDNKRNMKREIICAVGFRGHGKTCYFASLFFALDELTEVWKGFHTHAVNEESLDEVRKYVKSLHDGRLPEATDTVFPSPTIVEFNKMPKMGNSFFIFYDIGGEVFQSAKSMTDKIGNSDVGKAEFVSRSNTVNFVISTDAIPKPREMHDLLSIYVQGLDAMGKDTRNQHLLVIFTKGDLIENENLRVYLEQGSILNMKTLSYSAYFNNMKKLSAAIKKYLSTEMNAGQFVNFATDRFRSFECCLVSSLGTQPSEKNLPIKVTPKRVVDPLIWAIHNS